MLRYDMLISCCHAKEMSAVGYAIDADAYAPPLLQMLQSYSYILSLPRRAPVGSRRHTPACLNDGARFFFSLSAGFFRRLRRQEARHARRGNNCPQRGTPAETLLDL